MISGVCLNGGSCEEVMLAAEGGGAAPFECQCVGNFGGERCETAGGGGGKDRSLPDPNTDAFLQAQPEIGARTWVKCFDSAVDDASTPATFHSQCDPYAEMVTVARNSLGYTFGGYAEHSWNKDTCCADAANLNNPDNPVCQTAPNNDAYSCVDITASGNFLFGLEPGVQARFDPNGANTN